MLLVRTVLGPSTIHGTGIFARVFIPKGHVIWRFEEGYDLSLDRSGFEALSPDEKSEWERFSYVSRFTGRIIRSADDYVWMNHSHTPNIGTKLDPFRPAVEGCDFALRDILRGEELTFDYTWFGEDPCCHGEIGRLPKDLDAVMRLRP